jgi:chemotaxis signal transduction protein
LTHSALARYRRLPAQEPSLKLIVFHLRDHGFCLPLAMARRVIPSTDDDPARKLGMTQLYHDPVPLFDVAERVFQTAPPRLSPTDADALTTANRTNSILVVDAPRAGLLGLLVDGLPSIKRARKSAFSPVPKTYLSMHRLQGISTLVTPNSDQEPLFLLDLDALIH